MKEFKITYRWKKRSNAHINSWQTTYFITSASNEEEAKENLLKDSCVKIEILNIIEV